MAATEKIIDWNTHSISIILGIAGIFLIALNSLLFGFLLVVLALLYGAYKSDSSMEHTEAF